MVNPCNQHALFFWQGEVTSLCRAKAVSLPARAFFFWDYRQPAAGCKCLNVATDLGIDLALHLD